MFVRQNERTNWGIINPISSSGIYRSTNGGINWSPINTGFINYFQSAWVVRRLIINPENSNQVIAATSAGVFITNNAIAADPFWNRSSFGLDTTDFEYRGLEFQPGHSSTIYTSGKNIYRSTDSGYSWHSLTIPFGFNLDTLTNCKVNRINLAVTPADSTRLYAYIEGDYLCPTNPLCHVAQIAYIYMFKDGSWTQLHMQHNHHVTGHHADPYEQLSPCWLGFAASPVDANTLFFGFTKVKGCTNVLDSIPIWLSMSSYNNFGYHADCHALVFQPNAPNNPTLYAATHGGVNTKNIESYDHERGWATKYKGLNVALIWSFDVSKMYKDYFITGFQCNGIKIRHNIDRNIKWLRIIGGDGYGAQIGYQAERISFFDMNDEFWRHEYTPKYPSGTFLEFGKTIHDTINFLPSDPASFSTVMLPKTFQIHKHISDSNPIIGFTELFERYKKRPADPGDTLWKLQSDISKGQIPIGQRQITEFAIAPSNKKTIYIVIGGQIDPTWGIVPPQLYRSRSGGNNGNYSNDKFDNLTDSLPVIPGNTTIYHPIITGIAVHPSDPDKIWICFTGYYPSLKVYYSSNGGNSWSNYDSNGSLSNLPINGIVYQEGTDDRLYVATDAGVYVKNSPDSNWVRYGNIPNVRVTEIKINPCTGKLYAATFGRGLWETDLLPTNDVYQEIDTTETWSNDRILDNSFIVKSPNTLTVTGTLYMPRDSRIIIESGAELIIDGGRITQNCGYLWKGIELWGDHQTSQIPMTNQGKLQIINEGKLENAEIAILAGKRLNNNSGFDPAYGGGLIWCTDGNFINNKIAVLFTPYTYYNRSHFRNTEFITNSALNDSVQPDAFIKAYGVADVTINGCSFKNTRNWDDIPLDERGTGIFSENSRIFVDEGCLVNEVPCNEPLASSFEMLYRGIYSMNNGSITYADIKNTNFFDNVKGLYISASSGASHSTVLRCNFRVFRPGEEVIDSYGMYLNECSGYLVEENSYYSTGNYYDGIGLILNNSIVDNPAEINRIYRNTFTNLQYATIAQNRNRNASTGEGLCYKCNKFFDNYSDISVTKDPSSPSSNNYGIAVNQGTNIAAPTGPAGNMFDYTPLSSHWDLDNRLGHFNYYHHSGSGPQNTRLSPDYRQGLITSHAVNVGFTESIACPPTNSGGGISEDMDAMDSSEEKSDSIKNILNALVDGGSTEILKDEVIASTPPEALPTHDELLASSPYISDTVMQASIGKDDVLNNAMIRDIMVANPHSAKSELLVEMLKNRTIPMPDYLMAEILQGEDSVSGKEVLEAQVAFWNSDRSLHYHNLLRHFRCDSASGSTNDSLIYLLQLRNTIESWYDLVQVYFNKGEYQSGLNILNLIPSTFSLNEKQQNVHLSFVSFFGILKKVATDSSGVMNIDSTQKIMLDSIINFDQGHVSAFARNLLLAAGKTTYNEPIFLPENVLKSSKHDKYSGVKTFIDENYLNVHPNPAKTYFVVEYRLNEVSGGGRVEITDIMGKTLSSYPIDFKEEQKVISVNDMPSGVYVVTLKNKGKMVRYVKVTLISPLVLSNEHQNR